MVWVIIIQYCKIHTLLICFLTRQWNKPIASAQLLRSVECERSLVHVQCQFLLGKMGTKQIGRRHLCWGSNVHHCYQELLTFNGSGGSKVTAQHKETVIGVVEYRYDILWHLSKSIVHKVKDITASLKNKKKICLYIYIALYIKEFLKALDMSQ